METVIYEGREGYETERRTKRADLHSGKDQHRTESGAQAGSSRTYGGSRITVLNNDKKGAMTVKFRGTRFALGKRIADNIHVKEAAA